MPKKRKQPSNVDIASDEPGHGEQSLNVRLYPPKQGQTFRVLGVPLSWNAEALQGYLAKKVTRSHNSAGVNVHSLAQETHSRSHTATVTFSNIAPQLQALQAGKRLDIPLPIATNASGQPSHLILDKDFLGITTLYAPLSQDHKVDIVAISGLGGHAFGSFTERGGEHMWLRDALPYHTTGESDTEPIARVMVYGYESSLPQSQSFQNLEDLGTSLHTHLLSLVVDGAFRPIMFIAHSLGGLIVKQTLISLSKSTNEDDKKLLQAVYGIAFFGVPHDGMDISTLRSIVGNGPNRFLLESIGHINSQVLSIQQRDFRGALGDDGESEIVCFYETRKSPTAVKVNGRWEMAGPPAVLVSKPSATHCPPWESSPQHICAIDRSHSELVKFGPEDHEYEKALQRIKGFVARATRTKSPNLSNEELDCLKSLAFRQMYDRANDIEHAITGTCQWLLRHSTYTKWATSNRGLLWIKGKPGSGKSTLLKHAFQNQPRARSDLVLSFFFHDRGDELQKTPLGFFRSILHQILSKVPAALSDLVNEFKRKRDQIGEPDQKWQWHEGELWQFLKSSLPKVLETCSIWVFVDALDECGQENARNLVEQFRSLLEGLTSRSISPRHCRILFTCRQYPVLDGDSKLQICPEHENTEDISTYLQSRFDTYRRLKTSTLAELITHRANGVFMWARLVANEAIKLDSKGMGLQKIRTEINSIPKELDSLYEDLVKSMDEKPMSLKLIQWICFAKQPLLPGELYWALIVDAQCSYKSLQKCENHEEYGCDIGKRLKTLSRGLAEITPTSDTQVVQFIHQSVKNFFIEKGLLILDSSSTSIDMAIGMAHYQLSRTCVRYLAMEEISQSTVDDRNSLMTAFPLLSYAATSWIAHTEQSEMASQGDLLDCFDWPSEHLVQHWVRIYSIIDPYSTDCPPEGICMLHIVSRHQLMGALEKVLQRQDQVETIDVRNQHRRTPLLYASEKGHGKAVERLLEKGANPDSRDRLGWTPLFYAAARGHEIVVEALLANETNINSQDSIGATALHWVVWIGNEAIMSLLENAADIEGKDGGGGTPLAWAVEVGSEVMVRRLLDRDAMVNYWYKTVSELYPG